MRVNVLFCGRRWRPVVQLLCVLALFSQGGYTARTYCEFVISKLTPLSFSTKADVLAALGKSLDHIVRTACVPLCSCVRGAGVTR